MENAQNDCQPPLQLVDLSDLFAPDKCLITHTTVVRHCNSVRTDDKKKIYDGQSGLPDGMSIEQFDWRHQLTPYSPRPLPQSASD